MCSCNVSQRFMHHLIFFIYEFPILFCRDLSLEVLKREPEGSFIVRASNSKNGLALSVRVPQDFHPEGIVHYLIIRSPKGFKIKVSVCLSEIVIL